MNKKIVLPFTKIFYIAKRFIIALNIVLIASLFISDIIVLMNADCELLSLAAKHIYFVDLIAAISIIFAMLFALHYFEKIVKQKELYIENSKRLDIFIEYPSLKLIYANKLARRFFNLDESYYSKHLLDIIKICKNKNDVTLQCIEESIQNKSTSKERVTIVSNEKIIYGDIEIIKIQHLKNKSILDIKIDDKTYKRIIEENYAYSGIGKFEINLDKNIHFFDSGAFSIFDLKNIYTTEEDLKNKSLLQIVNERNRDFLEKITLAIEGVNNSNFSNYFECYVFTLSAKKKHIAFNAFKRINKNDEEFITFIIYDITKKLDYKEKFKKESQNLRIIFDNLPIATAWITSDLIIENVNLEFVNLMGADSKDNYIGKHISEFSSLKEIRAESIIKQVIEEKVQYIGFTKYYTSYGKLLNIKYITLPIVVNNQIESIVIFVKKIEKEV